MIYWTDWSLLIEQFRIISSRVMQGSVNRPQSINVIDLGWVKHFGLQDGVSTGLLILCPVRPALSTPGYRHNWGQWGQINFLCQEGKKQHFVIFSNTLSHLATYCDKTIWKAKWLACCKMSQRYANLWPHYSVLHCNILLLLSVAVCRSEGRAITNRYTATKCDAKLMSSYITATLLNILQQSATQICYKVGIAIKSGS